MSFILQKNKSNLEFRLTKKIKSSLGHSKTTTRKDNL